MRFVFSMSSFLSRRRFARSSSTCSPSPWCAPGLGMVRWYLRGRAQKKKA
jgi:hypothetical protein